MKTLLTAALIVCAGCAPTTGPFVTGIGYAPNGDLRIRQCMLKTTPGVLAPKQRLDDCETVVRAAPKAK